MTGARRRVAATVVGLALAVTLAGCATDSLEPWEGELALIEYESSLPARLQDWAAARRSDHQPGSEFVSAEDGTWIGVAAGEVPSTGYELVPQELVVVEYDTLDPDDDVLVLTVRVDEPTGAVADVIETPVAFYHLTPRFPGAVEVEIVRPDED